MERCTERKIAAALARKGEKVELEVAGRGGSHGCCLPGWTWFIFFISFMDVAGG
jgi:hypothetical protein